MNPPGDGERLQLGVATDLLSTASSTTSGPPAARSLRRVVRTLAGFAARFFALRP